MEDVTCLYIYMYVCVCVCCVCLRVFIICSGECSLACRALLGSAGIEGVPLEESTSRRGGVCAMWCTERSSPALERCRFDDRDGREDVWCSAPCPPQLPGAGELGVDDIDCLRSRRSCTRRTQSIVNHEYYTSSMLMDWFMIVKVIDHDQLIRLWDLKI